MNSIKCYEKAISEARDARTKSQSLSSMSDCHSWLHNFSTSHYFASLSIDTDPTWPGGFISMAYNHFIHSHHESCALTIKELEKRDLTEVEISPLFLDQIEYLKCQCRYYDHIKIIVDLPIYDSIAFKDNVLVVDSNAFHGSPFTRNPEMLKNSKRVNRSFFSSLHTVCCLSVLYRQYPNIEKRNDLCSDILPPKDVLDRIDFSKPLSVILTRGHHYQKVPLYICSEDKSLELEIVGVCKYNPPVIQRWFDFAVAAWKSNLENVDKELFYQQNVSVVSIGGAKVSFRNVAFVCHIASEELKGFKHLEPELAFSHHFVPLKPNIRRREYIMAIGELAEVQINNCRFENKKKGSTTMIIQGRSTDVKIQDCVFQSGLHAILTKPGALTRSCQIMDCKFCDQQDISIWMIRLKNGVIRNCSFENTVRGVFVDGGQSCDISGCRFEHRNLLKDREDLSQAIIRCHSISFVNTKGTVRRCFLNGFISLPDITLSSKEAKEVIAVVEHNAGIVVNRDSHLRISRCDVSGFFYGVLSDFGNEMTLEDCVLENCRVGLRNMGTMKVCMVKNVVVRKCRRQVITCIYSYPSMKFSGSSKKLRVEIEDGLSYKELEKNWRRKSIRERKMDSDRARECSDGGFEIRCCYCWLLEPKGEKFKLCGGCRINYYCGKECQKKDWKNHKKFCNCKKNGKKEEE